MSTTFSRRKLLGAALAGAVLGPAAARFAPSAIAAGDGTKARRIIFFYFPDGVPVPQGGPNLWFPTGGERDFKLPTILEPLAKHKDVTLFLKGLSMGGTDSGSHPGGAKKLLTGVDGGNGESIDRYLSRTFGGAAPFRHVYLGAQATVGGTASDKFISYPSAGSTAPPEDDPRRAFERFFGAGVPSGGSNAGGSSPPPKVDTAALSVLDTAFADLNDLKGRLGDAEKAKIDQHTDAMRDVERRLRGLPGGGGGGGNAPLPSCSKPRLDGNVSDSAMSDPALFPDVLRAQIDVTVLAMACGLTRVGVVQASSHTSELIMSRFPNTDIYKQGFDMRSHQASHYGQPSDSKFPDYAAQRKWFASQVAYLLDQLAARPEGDGTMLDYSLVVVCSEVSDGNTHSHDDMPFLLCGKGGGSVRTGRFVDLGFRRHSDFLVTLARACGDPIDRFGQECQGPLSQILA